MTAIEQFATFVVAYRGETLSAAQRTVLGLHIADTVGGWVGAMRTREGRHLLGLRERWRGASDDATLALMVNCALARLSETDDIHLASMTTPGAIVIPAALTLAGGAQHDEIAAAMVVGYEAMIRLGLVMDGPSVLYRGIWPTYFGAPFAVAATAARLLRLAPAQTAHALAGALALAAPCVGRHGEATTARWWAMGRAAANGLAATLAAQAGLTSDLALLEGEFLKSIYGVTPNLAALGERLGEEPFFARASFKPWCAARQTMAATQALKELMASGVAPGDMMTIEAFVPPPHLAMVNHGVRAGERASFLTSLSYQLAVAALDPDAAFDIGQSQGEPAPAVAQFMRRIKVSADAALLAEYPSCWPARLVATTPQGTRAHAVAAVPGDPARPLDEGQLRAKFARLTGWCSNDSTLFDRACAVSARGGHGELMAELDRLAVRAMQA